MAARGSAVQDGRKEDQAAAKVRQIGSKTFYWKHERWIDSSVTPEEDEKATVVDPVERRVLPARPDRRKPKTTST